MKHPFYVPYFEQSSIAIINSNGISRQAIMIAARNVA